MIAGGESGPGARPMHPDWARQIRDQCQAAGIPFFFKQWGEWAAADNRDGILINASTGEVGLPGGRWGKPAPLRDDADVSYTRIGKSRAGRLLDGRTWDEMPGHAAQREKVPS